MRNKIMRFVSKSISILLVFALVFSVFPVFSHAEENDNDPVIVVSLGDSYSSGEGIEPFYGQSKALSERVKDKDWLAHRSELSWPSQIQIPKADGTLSGKMGEYRADYGAVSDEYEWYFGAVSGAETKHFTKEEQVKKYTKKVYSSLMISPIITYRDNVPLPKQTDIFDNIDGEVDYVTFTIGGNDVDFADIIKTCVLQPDSLFGNGGNGTAYFLDKKMGKLRDGIEGYMSDIKQEYREVALKAPNAEIIVPGYPKLLCPEGKSKVITKDEAEIVNTNVSWFNDQIENAINELDEVIKIHFVDVETEFDKDGGHAAYSADPWINPIYAGAKEQDINDDAISSSYSVHPNAKGAEAYARCVNKKIKNIEENKEKQGTLSGKIVKASDRTTPVTTATVNVMKDNKTISFQPDSNGSYSRELPVGTHYVKVVADGYIEFNAYADIEEDQTVYMETFLMVEGEEGEIGTSTGTITNALTGAGVEGVQLDVRSGWNNDSVGDILTTVTTNSSGNYTVTLPIGNYTLCASKNGYISTMLNIVVQKDICSVKDGSMTPIISGDNYRIVLDWGENPRDLDAHVAGKLSDGNSFHVYYGDKSQYDGDIEICNLDIDHQHSEGPETITLKTNTSEPYYYFIHHYAGSGTIASSGAQVKVYQGENEVATFNVPTDLGSGIYWNVFAIVDGQLVVRNTMTSSAETSYANSNVSTFGLRAPRTEEYLVYDDAYPAKETEVDDVIEPTEEAEVTEATEPVEVPVVEEDEIVTEEEVTVADLTPEETIAEETIALIPEETEVLSEDGEAEAETP